jgi:hypothetical protein
VHTPATHELPGVHVPPAAHDWPRSIGGVMRGAIDVAQRPSSQTRPASHAVSQAPQWAGSLVSSTHTPPHRM